MLIRRHRKSVEPIASINLTSLLDVTFVLLLAFMIVAPALKSGLDIQLPQVKEPPQMTTQQSVTISIEPRKQSDLPRVFIQGKRKDLEALEKDLAERFAQYGTKLDVVIEADRTVPCEDLFKVFAITQKIGIDNVGIPLEAERE